MPRKKPKSTETSTIRINGDMSGQVAIGNQISQSQTYIHETVTPADLDTLQRLFQALHARVDTEVAPGQKEAAHERVQELEQAITEKKPDLTTMEYVKNWFGKHIPSLAGMVVSIVVHPIVGKLVEAGGDLLVKDFQRRFGSEA